VNERRFRLDLTIAVSALLISTIAALASVYQTRVISQQLSAAVWPYLNIDRTNAPTGVTISLTNYGLGPALIRSAQLDVNGKPAASWNDLIVAFVRRAHTMHLKGTTRTSDANLDGSMVLSPGATRRLFDVQANGPALRVVRETLGDVSLSICYCSLLGQCWQMTSNQSSGPTATSSCPAGASIAAPTPPP